MNHFLVKRIDQTRSHYVPDSPACPSSHPQMQRSRGRHPSRHSSQSSLSRPSSSPWYRESSSPQLDTQDIQNVEDHIRDLMSQTRRETRRAYECRHGDQNGSGRNQEASNRDGRNQEAPNHDGPDTDTGRPTKRRCVTILDIYKVSADGATGKYHQLNQDGGFEKSLIFITISRICWIRQRNTIPH